MTATTPEDAIEHEARREVLVVLYRHTPTAAVAHVVAAGLVVYAFAVVIDTRTLFVWWMGLTLAAIARLVAAKQFVARWPIDDAALPVWVSIQSVLAFVHTAFWGATVFIIWPESVEYRALMAAVLIGIISAGGMMLATHTRSFIIYCAPIAVPLVYQLMQGGGRVQDVLAGMVILYVAVLLIAVSRLESTFFEGLKLRLQMDALSKTDALTDLSNRRGFDEYLNDAWQNSVRSSQSVGLILVDIDFFKEYNDRYGHPKGDEALVRVAQLIRSAASRGTDLCARIGGEEFAIVMSATDLDGSIRIARDIKAAIHGAALDHGGSRQGILTLSMGVSSCIPTQQDASKDFLETTDRALYKAKNNGRDRVEVADPA